MDQLLCDPGSLLGWHCVSKLATGDACAVVVALALSHADWLLLQAAAAEPQQEAAVTSPQAAGFAVEPDDDGTNEPCLSRVHVAHVWFSRVRRLQVHDEGINFVFGSL